MTADQFRTARKTLGHTQHSMADTLGMGRWGFQTVGKWESGKSPVPGPVAMLVERLLQDAKP